MNRDKKVKVAVSEDMVNLRKIQHDLNQFLWSSELCYGYFLEHFKFHPEEKEMKVGEVFFDIPIEAWFLNDKGNIKYPATVPQHIENVKKNFVIVCKSTIVYFHAAFEHYLKNRILNLRPTMRSWGPFIHSISDNSLIEQLNFETIVSADICRLIRNEIAHRP